MIFKRPPLQASAVGASKRLEKVAIGESSGELDRGLDAVALAKLRGTWQLGATGKPAAASVLNEFKVQRVASGKLLIESARATAALLSCTSVLIVQIVLCYCNRANVSPAVCLISMLAAQEGLKE